MPFKRHIVTLTPEERERLNRVVASNKTSIRQRCHARILLAADTGAPGGGQKDQEVAQIARTSRTTVSRVRQRYAQEGLDAVLNHRAQVNRKKRALDGRAEAHLIALACGAPPEGHKRWTLHLLKDALMERRYTDSVSHETVRQTLKKTSLSLG